MVVQVVMVPGTHGFLMCVIDVKEDQRLIPTTKFQQIENIVLFLIFFEVTKI